MKEIRLKYVDFWKGFNYKEDFIFKYLENSTHFKVNISDTPDYIIYSVFGNKHLIYNNCVKIFFTGENCCPDFNLCDYAIGFDYISFGDRYFRFPLYLIPQYSEYYDMMISKKNLDVIHDDFCSFVYSNSNSDDIRNLFFSKLCEYKKVDSGGKYLNNIGRSVTNKLEFEKKHKFSIAFENVSHEGYTTEKIVQSFAAGSIPIYWGNPKIKEEFNPKSFICVMDYPTIDECINKIISIDNNRELYINMLLQPAIIDDSKTKDSINKQMATFLFNIFSVDKKNAFRRNFYGYSKDYYRYCCDMNRYSFLVKIKNKIRNKISLLY